ncbi:hypothetical protein S40285_07440 [Stachybotrys chlorohalonatus IBT 40285]|uniref:Phospholipase/carboxylesterase/thioesterase domain-containing protein n=1 Tax=Stachybotrys chlorohalonatus (strain IBT 40285) TaxID=1283841 RepID=A0A084QAP9_STAC4|nr:hypothetical protein S40285_07440 [Stachybotrys chlorohalonata IBT 40285]
MPPRVPSEADFAPLSSTLPVALHFPSPPESTTAFLVLFHGLGDHEPPFAGFAASIALPGVLAISVRGTTPLPPSLLPPGSPPHHFYWGDDLALDEATGEFDDDPGFERASKLVMDKLVRGVLIDACGWDTRDIILFGFGQGGSLALGLASRLRSASLVVDVTEQGSQRDDEANSHFKGVVSIGGPLPMSMVPTSSARAKSKTSVLLLQVGDEHEDAVRAEFEHVKAVRWKRPDMGMPRDKDEVLPLMTFFAERLRTEL